MANDENFCLHLNEFKRIVKTSYQRLQDVKDFCDVFSSVISNPASKIIQTDTSSVILRKYPMFLIIQKVGS